MNSLKTADTESMGAGAADAPTVAASVRDLSKSYRTRGRPPVDALRDVSIDIVDGNSSRLWAPAVVAKARFYPSWAALYLLPRAA
jgi:hypothetical protein